MKRLLNEDLADRLRQAIERAQAAGALPAFDIPAVPVERPKQAAHGDYATPIAMQLARLARQAPIKIAETLVRYFEAPDYVGGVEAAAPGYINLSLSPQWLAAQADAIRAQGEAFGSVDLGAGTRLQVEFVSANPTGPLHTGSARNAVLGDTVANVLAAAGYDVEREYYVNDAGSRMHAFYTSVYARYAQALGADEPVPEDGYLGTYLIEWGRRIAEEEGDRYLLLPREDAIPLIGERGLAIALESIRSDLAAMGVSYNRWFSERTLYEPVAPAPSLFDRVVGILRRGGYVEEREGAVWFKATALGGDKDEVIIRSNGQPGYFASDIAYHYDKFVVRGFDRVIDVWGADHQGHVPRMKALMRALELDPERLEFMIYQLVTLRRGGEIVRLSKRTGDIITLREVLDEIGPDALRFFLLARSADSQMDLDLELAVKQSDENPVYYVQYAHARIASILRRAGDLPIEEGDVSLLVSEPEQNLLRQLLRLPEVVHQAAAERAPHHLTYYAQELAGVFHGFYRDCRVVSSDPADREITLARLKLVDAARIVLARTLHLMGMSAPETM
ncbi:MAG TPA: arginine--tRNA ligase [Anaerolineae bacterium]|nr:arginine--tRNA ligase [Anaerolineae bacterium]HOQ99492.1 arginine--tRNA ligase [Anaerolineae bacterium]HPL29938.1 arginine--tRNA ligase [Anaerolineae bacterium]